MRIVLSVHDDIMARFGNQIGALGEKARPALSRAMNHTGAKARTQVVRASASRRR